MSSPRPEPGPSSSGTITPGPRLRLTRETSQLLDRTARLLRERGQAAAADLVERGKFRAAHPPVAVVVGEVQRGKSTLVNALSGTTICPTGGNAGMDGAIAVVPPADGLPVGSAELTLSDGSTRIETVPEIVNRVAASADGAGDGSRPIGVRVAVDQRWLQGLALFDTPGVGGLDAGAIPVLTSLAAQASALLFVSDGGQVLTAPELRLLTALAEATDRVIFVLTKVDRNPGGWLEVLAENRRLLSQHAPRFTEAPVYPVAAAQAVEAQSLPPEVAELFERSSGLAELATALAAVVADHDRLSLTNALRAGHSGLLSAEGALAFELETVRGEIVPDVDADVAGIARLRRHLKRSRLDTERDLGRVREEAIRCLNDAGDRMTERVTADIQAGQVSSAKGAEQAFDQLLTSEMTAIVDAVRQTVEVGVSGVVAAAFSGLAEAPPLAADLLPAALPGIEPRVRRRPRPSSRLVDPSMASNAFLGTTLATVMGLGGPFGLVAAGGWVAYTAIFRRRREGQQRLTAAVNDSVNALRRDLSAAVDAVLREIRPELHTAVEDHLATAVQELEAAVRAARAAAGRSEAERLAQERNLERVRAALVAQRAELHERLQALGGLPGTSAAPPPSNAVSITTGRGSS